MTNGDKLLSVFDEALIYRTYKEERIIKVCVDNLYINTYDLDWWNSEYKDNKHILFRLSGRFGVFANNGNIVLERWD